MDRKKMHGGDCMDDHIYELADDFSLFKGDFKEKRFQLFNITDGTIYKLNEVAYDMLSLFDGEKNVKEVVTELKKLYNVNVEKLKEDLYAVAAEWAAKKILIKKESK
jgi:hypothetical protein